MVKLSCHYLLSKPVKSKWTGNSPAEPHCYTLTQKRNSSPFHLQILKRHGGGGVRGVMGLVGKPNQLPNSKSELHWSKKVPPHFLNFKLNKRGVSFLSECIIATLNKHFDAWKYLLKHVKVTSKDGRFYQFGAGVGIGINFFFPYWNRNQNNESESEPE